GVNCFAGSALQWKNRMFWPGCEDPATGSAAGPLACHLARHGRIAWGDEIVVSQGGFINRPSTLYARADGSDGLIDRVGSAGRPSPWPAASSGSRRDPGVVPDVS